MNYRKGVALGVCAVGAGLGIAYYVYNRRSRVPDGLVPLTLELEQSHVTWLEEMAGKYTDGNCIIALGKLVEYCKVVGAEGEGAEVIFKKVRCNACNGKQKVSFIAMLTPVDVEFIEASTATYEIPGGRDKTVRVMFEYVINDTVHDEVFGS